MARKKQIIKHISKPISECLEIFIKHCQTKNLSKRTLKTYRAECNYFVNYTVLHGHIFHVPTSQYQNTNYTFIKNKTNTSDYSALLKIFSIF